MERPKTRLACLKVKKVDVFSRVFRFHVLLSYYYSYLLAFCYSMLIVGPIACFSWTQFFKSDSIHLSSEFLILEFPFLTGYFTTLSPRLCYAKLHMTITYCWVLTRIQLFCTRFSLLLLTDFSAWCAFHSPFSCL